MSIGEYERKDFQAPEGFRFRWFQVIDEIDIKGCQRYFSANKSTLAVFTAQALEGMVA